MSYVNEADVVRGYKRVLQRNNNLKNGDCFFIIVVRSCTYLAFQTSVKMYFKVCKDGCGENTSYLVSKGD